MTHEPRELPQDTGPVMDLAEALDRCGGDHELLAELVALFYEDLPTLVEQISRAVAMNDAAGLTHAAHTLKGAVGNFSAQPAFAAARALEYAGREEQMAMTTELLADLKAELDRLEPALRAAAQA